MKTFGRKNTRIIDSSVTKFNSFFKQELKLEWDRSLPDQFQTLPGNSSDETEPEIVSKSIRAYRSDQKELGLRQRSQRVDGNDELDRSRKTRNRETRYNSSDSPKEIASPPKARKTRKISDLDGINENPKSIQRVRSNNDQNKRKDSQELMPDFDFNEDTVEQGLDNVIKPRKTRKPKDQSEDGGNQIDGFGFNEDTVEQGLDNVIKPRKTRKPKDQSEDGGNQIDGFGFNEDTAEQGLDNVIKSRRIHRKNSKAVAQSEDGRKLNGDAIDETVNDICVEEQKETNHDICVEKQKAEMITAGSILLDSQSIQSSDTIQIEGTAMVKDKQSASINVNSLRSENSKAVKYIDPFSFKEGVVKKKRMMLNPKKTKPKAISYIQTTTKPKTTILNEKVDSPSTPTIPSLIIIQTEKIKSPRKIQKVQQDSDDSDSDHKTKAIHELTKSGHTKRNNDSFEYYTQSLSSKNQSQILPVLTEILYKIQKRKQFVRELLFNGVLGKLFKIKGEYMVRYCLAVVLFLAVDELGLDAVLFEVEFDGNSGERNMESLVKDTDTVIVRRNSFGAESGSQGKLADIVVNHGFLEYLYTTIEFFKATKPPTSKYSKTLVININKFKEIEELIISMGHNPEIQSIIMILFSKSNITKSPPLSFLDIISNRLTKNENSLLELVLLCNMKISTVLEPLPSTYYEKTIPVLIRYLLVQVESDIKIAHLDIVLKTVLNLFGPWHQFDFNIDLSIIDLYKILESDHDSFVLFLGLIINVLFKRPYYGMRWKSWFLNMLEVLCSALQSEDSVGVYKSILVGVFCSRDREIRERVLEFMGWNDFRKLKDVFIELEGIMGDSLKNVIEGLD
jgi:hypothetical protein